MRRLRPLCVALLLPLAAQAADPAPEADRWFSVTSGGRPIGWMHLGASVEEGHIVTEQTTHFAFRRGADVSTVETRFTFEETLEGVPVRATGVQRMGQLAEERTLTFRPDGVLLEVQQAGQRRVEQLPLASVAWSPPFAAQREEAAALAAGSQAFSIRTLDPTLGTDPYTQSFRVSGRAEVSTPAGPVQAWVLETSMSNMPGVTQTTWLDAGALPVRMQLSMGTLELEMRQVERAEAVDFEPGAELMVATLAHADRAIRAPRTLRRATLELRLLPAENGAREVLADMVGSADWQRVRVRSDARVTLEQDLDRPPSIGPPPGPEYLRGSTWLNVDDPEIRALAARALTPLPATATPAERAEALRRFVLAFVHTVDLSVGFASASEVARNARGDCTEHGVLLAALLRVAGIPSRVASGLVYMDRFIGEDGVFGYHLWTQAWLPGADGAGRWVDLDPTLSPTVPFDATHILLGTSALGEGAGTNDMVRSSALMGRLDIRVLRPR